MPIPAALSWRQTDPESGEEKYAENRRDDPPMAKSRFVSARNRPRERSSVKLLASRIAVLSPRILHGRSSGLPIARKSPAHDFRAHQRHEKHQPRRPAASSRQSHKRAAGISPPTLTASTSRAPENSAAENRSPRPARCIRTARDKRTETHRRNCPREAASWWSIRASSRSRDSPRPARRIFRLRKKFQKKISCAAPVTNAAMVMNSCSGWSAGQIFRAARVRVAPDPARNSQKMHRHEDAIDARERQPEMQLSQRFVHGSAEHLRKPVIRRRENPENRRHAHDDVKVRHDVVRRVQHRVHRRLRQENPRKPAGDEKRNEPDGKQHRRMQLNFPAPHRTQAS